MARKDRSFAAKIAHATETHTMVCPVCNKNLEVYKVVKGEKSSKTSSFRFKERHVKLCACNKGDYGL